ncbi:MAG: flagellar motor switch protein FliM [Gammaproteobacteria bacterium]|nr:flagellar motor switch protein FliM [Gammaproteobacteria bacterium]
MSAEVLNQDEIDALLKGVGDGAVDTASVAVPGEAHSYDLATQTRIARERMPTLETVNERCAQLLRLGLGNLMRRAAGVSVAPVQLVRFSEYVQMLQVPCSLNLVKVQPLRGTGLIMLDARLVFTVVDSFFGGTGRHTRIEGREFTSTESRIIHMVLRQAFASLSEAWAAVLPLSIDYLRSEINPQFASIVSPSEVVVVSPFRIEFEDGGGQRHGGEFHVTMPYSMLEPLRKRLEAGMRSERGEPDERWPAILREEIEEAEVELVPVLGQTRLTVGRLLDLKPGDVIPCDFDGQLTLYAEGVPLLRGTYGASRGQQAVKVQGRIARRPSARTHSPMVGTT